MESVLPPPPPYKSKSGELASALQRLRLETRLEAPPPPKTAAAVEFANIPEATSYEEVRRGGIAAAAAVVDIFAEAMKFWRGIEEAAAEQIADAGQEALAAITTEYKV